MVRDVWGSYLNKGNQGPFQESDPGFIKTGRIFFWGLPVGCWSGLLPCWEDISANLASRPL